MTFNYVTYQWGYIGFYDSVKNPISTIYANNEADTIVDHKAQGTLDSTKIPSNAAYIRFTANIYGLDYISLIRTA